MQNPPIDHTQFDARAKSTDRAGFVDHVFAELREMEKAIPGGTGSSKGRFVDGGDWLIRPGFALKCLRQRLWSPSRHPILAGVSYKGMVRLGRAYLRNAVFSVDSIASAVNVRRRTESCVLRSFYPTASQPATIKACLSGHGRLKWEVKNRRIVEEVQQLRVPKIILHNLSARCPFLLEEYISGRIAFRRGDHRLLTRTLLPSLQRHYAAYGVSYGSIESCCGSDMYDKVASIAQQYPWDPSWRDRQEFLLVVRRLADSDKRFALSFCHGDLSVGHVAISRSGEISLLDWESAGIYPIAFDLVKVQRTCRNCPGSFQEDCEQLLNNVSMRERTNDLMSPAEQMFLASLRKLYDWERYRAQCETLGRDSSQALKAIFFHANESLCHV